MRFFIFVAAAFMFTPLTAFADCASDLAVIKENAKPEERIKLESPRAKALFEKSQKLLNNHNEKECADTIKGLYQLMGNRNN